MSKNMRMLWPPETKPVYNSSCYGLMISTLKMLSSVAGVSWDISSTKYGITSPTMGAPLLHQASAPYLHVTTWGP